ncbi:cation:proton antiporter [Thermogymnomonas acidicola]|uniref:cation:proton antiporter domain-containing protein n=1 Tax=Thermogymnomonas acidicola TaxID=399579 RepID=UPI00094646D2|nr:cation:proton antiporter [Thermogymnomonas acidicola]
MLGLAGQRYNITDVVGALATGLILGPFGLGLITPDPAMSGIEDISLFFIVLLIGVEVTTDLFRAHMRKGGALFLHKLRCARADHGLLHN